MEMKGNSDYKMTHYVTNVCGLFLFIRKMQVFLVKLLKDTSRNNYFN